MSLRLRSCKAVDDFFAISSAQNNNEGQCKISYKMYAI